jgi:putative membrane protein insertion efficiency factor
MRRAIIYLIRGYRYLLSPLLGQNCRFYPSCSHYTEQAVERFGLMKGGYLATKRVCRCHPWNAGGVDEVPEKKNVSLYG